jgi:hypothetical protein
MHRSIFFAVTLLLATSSILHAQEPAVADEGEVLILDEIRVEVQVEAPRVTITKVRKKPVFDYLQLEKDFNVEMLALLNSVNYQSVTSGRVEGIDDIDKLIKIPRQLE